MRWILAFDSSCVMCQEVSLVVASAAGDRLELLALTDPVVEGWRRSALGEDAPFAPTLLRVSGERVAAWTGRTMGPPLMWALGPVVTAKVLLALGRMRDDHWKRIGREVPAGGRGRTALRRLRAGAEMGAAILTMPPPPVS